MIKEISKKNAARIRRGIMEGKNAIVADRTGFPYFPARFEDKLERRAYLHTLRAEMNRLARESLKTAKKLKRGKR